MTASHDQAAVNNKSTGPADWTGVHRTKVFRAIWYRKQDTPPSLSVTTRPYTHRPYLPSPKSALDGPN